MKNVYLIMCVGDGFVFIGRKQDIVSQAPAACFKEPYLLLKTGCTIRLWGTSHALGELAIHGPQSGTKLDAIKTPVYFREAAIHNIYEVDPSQSTSWSKRIDAAMLELLNA